MIRSENDATRLDWAVDSDYRFFPTQPDPLFGYRLHPVDMATNKMMASVNRRETRDILDLAAVFAGILPAGPLAWACAEKSPGYSPDMILHQLKRHSAARQSDLDGHRPCAVTDAGELNSIGRQACDRGQDWIDSVPGEFGFGLFVDAGNRPCCPDFSAGAPEGVRIHEGARKGVWPTSPDISNSMLEDISGGTGSGPACEACPPGHDL